MRINLLKSLGIEKHIVWSNNIFLPKCKNKPNKFKNYTYRIFLKYISKEDRWIRDNFKGRSDYDNYLIKLAQSKDLNWDNIKDYKIKQGQIYFKNKII